MSGTLVGSFTVEDLAILIGLWFVTSMVANLLWTRFVVLKYVGRALIAWLENLEHDKEGMEAVNRFLDRIVKYLATREIRVEGEFEKVATDEVDAEGKVIYKQIPLVMTPITLMARSISSYVIMKFKGSVGGTKNQVKQMFMDSMAETGSGPSQAALTALARGNIGPLIAEVGMPYVQELLNKKKAGINTQESGTKW